MDRATIHGVWGPLGVPGEGRAEQHEERRVHDDGEGAGVVAYGSRHRPHLPVTALNWANTFHCCLVPRAGGHPIG